jgi:hypothetical protein
MNLPFVLFHWPFLAVFYNVPLFDYDIKLGDIPDVLLEVENQSGLNMASLKRLRS